MKQLFSFITFSLIIITLSSCKTKPYEPSGLINQDSGDSIMTELATYLGKRPRGVLREDRFNPEHKSHFENLAERFELIYYHKDENRHYYYILRPARNHEGSAKRGVGGWFEKVGEEAITAFMELFNTPILPEKELIDKGLELFSEMIATGNTDKFSGKKGYIEWPDARTKYDPNINEWVYIAD